MKSEIMTPRTPKITTKTRFMFILRLKNDFEVWDGTLYINMFLWKCDAIGQDTLKRALLFILVSKQTNSLRKQTCLFVSWFKIEYRHEYTFNSDNMHEKNF